MRIFSAIALAVLMLLGVAALGAGSSALAATGGPTVTLSSTSGTTTSATSIPITAVFSSSVSGFAAADVTVTNGTVANFAGSGTNYSFDVMPTAAGTVTVNVAADVSGASPDNQASNTLTFTSTMDTGSGSTTPEISNVTVNNITQSGATINWTTDVASNSQVFYGTTSAYGSSTSLDTTTGTSHSVNLSNLNPNTTYHFQVASGVGSTSAATSSDMTFTTSSSTSSGTTTLAIVGIDTVNSTAIANGSFEVGWQWIIHFTVPTNETSFQLRFNDFTSAGTSNTIPATNIRYYSAQSSNATNADSAITETNNDYGGALTLTGDTSTTTAGRQVDVVVQVAVPQNTPTGSYSTLFGARSTGPAATTTATTTSQ